MNIMSLIPEPSILKSIIQEKIDMLTNLRDRARLGKATDPEIDHELRNMIIVIIVNLKSSTSYIAVLKDLAGFIKEIHSFLVLAINRGFVSDTTFQKNCSFLSNKLISCNKLPQNFIKDQVSLLNGK